ncbi:vitronectin isoform 3-T3 [Discoglossus pictus]
MKGLLLPAILLGALITTQADTDSCKDRCNDEFNVNNTCQCDVMCMYFESCCPDFTSFCEPLENGNIFLFPQDYDYEEATLDHKEMESTVASSSDATMSAGVISVTETESHAHGGTETVPTTEPHESVVTTPEPRSEEEEGGEDDLCSGRSFDAFTTFKNGSVYAFRGKYFFEVEKDAVDVSPRLIKDVWGIEGPIDAAFTRMNCQGKTFIFKGTKYWRFLDGVLDEGYPREISDGFLLFPSNIDAAFAVPANNYNGKEKAYFFKGNKYWIYEFKTQPSQAECEGSAPSEVFKSFAGLRLDSWEDFFDGLFGTGNTKINKGPLLISKDWKGLPSKVDAVMLSRIYVPQKRKYPLLRRSKKRKSRRRYNRRRKPTRELILNDDIDDDKESDPDWLPWHTRPRCKPVQSVYFFRKDKYYRVNLQTKRVDKVNPRYPRHIAQYWFGCNQTSVAI